MRIILQIIGIPILLLGLTIATLKIENRNADGPSILFPGGALQSGELHMGPEPDWSFAKEVVTIELQLEDPVSSRRIFIIESAGKVYIPSGYMRSVLGRIWKDWAFQADAGDGLAVARIEGVRYERQLVRITDDNILSGVAAELTKKYAADSSPEAIKKTLQSMVEGDTWIFEMAPRGISR